MRLADQPTEAVLDLGVAGHGRLRPFARKRLVAAEVVLCLMAHSTRKSLTPRAFFGLAALLALGCAGHHAATTPATGTPVSTMPASEWQALRPRPGESVRVVRFQVKPDRREEFEEFFWHSLKPAAERLAPDGEDPIGGFRLLIPQLINRDGYFTYYVMVDPVAGERRTGQAMRDMVREAFPGDDGQARVRRWMSSIVLGDLAPVGEQFVEADLSAPEPPDHPE